MKIPDFLFCELHHMIAGERRHLLEPAAELKAVGIDGLDRLTLACAIDEALHTEVPDHELIGWNTVGDVVDSALRRGARDHNAAI